MNRLSLLALAVLCASCESVEASGGARSTTYIESGSGVSYVFETLLGG